MRILHTVESYLPSLGGMQEVVRQLSERLCALGHEVTVATGTNTARTDTIVNGVKIKEFSITGNMVHGMTGEVEAYRQFVVESDFEIMVNFAAQQWATDALLPILGQLKMKKVFVPTGFSGLFQDIYKDYFVLMRSWMCEYDINIFLSQDYRDINFARECGAKTLVIPNGASTNEFLSEDVPDIRKKLSIPNDDFFILHVGSHTGAKGHAEVIEIFARAEINNATLVIIGNDFGNGCAKSCEAYAQLFERNFGYFLNIKHLSCFMDQFRSLIDCLFTWMKRKKMKHKSTVESDLGENPANSHLILLRQIGCIFVNKLSQLWQRLVGLIIIIAKREQDNKRFIITSLPRAETVAAYKQADLFLFPSQVECSPIVLFECAASHTPFLTTDVGNAGEIIEWMGSGVLLPTKKDDFGRSKAVIKDSAKVLEQIYFDNDRRKKLAETGFRAWREKFTWEKIAEDYEKVYRELLSKS